MNFDFKKYFFREIGLPDKTIVLLSTYNPFTLFFFYFIKILLFNVANEQFLNAVFPDYSQFEYFNKHEEK